MGNVLSKEQQLSDDANTTWRQLISLGFDCDISFQAAERHGPIITKCVEYIIKQQMKSNVTNADAQQGYEERIECVLALQRFTNEQHIGYDIYDLVETAYGHKNGINQFVSDCGMYAMSIDDFYMEHINKCDMECEYIQREYRNRDINEHSSNLRSILIQQFIDQAHINKYHLTDIGLRSHAKQSVNQMIKRRKRFNKIRNDNSKSNKFVTQILDHDEDDSKHNHHTSYSFGVRFYYHKYYKNNTTTHEVLPGTRGNPERGNVHINKSYSYSSWFVSPKHKTIKDEVLNDTKHGLTIFQYDNTVLKAMMKHKAMIGTVKGALSLWKIVYEILEGSPIRMKHILAVLLYTNHTDLSAAFSRSFRKVIGSESDNELKDRHSNYANWARLLREAVECWGCGFWQTTQTRSTFYHGISKKMIFDGFNQFFCCPTSTTLQYETAIMFANQCEGDEEGIVINIKNNGLSASFFDCIRWSDYAGESEMLFLGGYEPLEICGLTVIGNEVNVSYDEWIQSIKVFQTGMIKGSVSTDKVTPSNAEQIDLLVGNVMNKRKALDIIPEYIKTLFENVLYKTTHIAIDIGRLNDEVCFWMGDVVICQGKMIGEVYYGYKLLKHLYFDDKNEMKWNVWQQLFPSLERIHIKNIAKIPNEMHGYKWSKSIFVNDVLLLNILSFLKQKKMKDVGIYSPSNSMDSLNKLIKTYSSSYEKIGYKLMVDNKFTHPQYGSCVIVAIFSITQRGRGKKRAGRGGKSKRGKRGGRRRGRGKGGQNK